MSMKKMLCIVLASATVLAFTACSGKKDEPKTDDSTTAATQAAQQEAETAADSAAETQAAGRADTTALAQAVPGTLYTLYEGDSTVSPITGLRLVGNRAGTVEGVNGKAPAAENIRSVFELNEWIEIYPETTFESGLTACLVPHAEDPGVYAGDYVVPDNAVIVELVKPEDDAAWGSLYYNSDDGEPGYYDLVLLSSGKPVGLVMIKLFNEAELESKTDAELEQLMQEN